MSWGRLPTCRIQAGFRQVGNLPHDIDYLTVKKRLAQRWFSYCGGSFWQRNRSPGLSKRALASGQ